jgi:hypothetical protein
MAAVEMRVMAPKHSAGAASFLMTVSSGSMGDGCDPSAVLAGVHDR